MPVVDSEETLEKQRVLGILTVGDIIHAYRRTLTKDLRRMRGLVKGTVMLETKIEPTMPLVGHPLREARLPDDCL
jgi:Mg/Co/Ni transporter MgtE